LARRRRRLTTLFVAPTDPLTIARDNSFSRYGAVAHLMDGAAQCTVSVNPHTCDETGAPIGLIGDFGDALATAATLEPALQWLRERGCRIVRGPITRHTWYPFRAVLSGFDACPPLKGEPWNAVGLADSMQEHGFEQVAWYASTWTHDSQTQIGRSEEQLGRLETGGYRVRALDPARLEADLALIHDVTLRSFSQPFNYMFVPIDLAEFQLVLGPGAGGLDPELVVICHAPDGTPAGFCYTTVEGPDLASIKTLVVAPEHRGTGAGSALVAMTHATCRRRGLTRVIHALMRQGGPSIAISNRGGHEVFRRYAVLERAL